MSYCNYLCEINKYVCGDKSKIREYASNYFSIIDNAINEVIYNSNTHELIIYNSMKVTALIKFFQPFYDGNHRTALILFGNLLKHKGLTFDFISALNDMNNHKLNIPTIYDPNEEIADYQNWYKYIETKNQIKKYLI